MAIVRWDPARELASMEIDRLNQMFSDFYGEAFSRRLGAGGRHLRDRRARGRHQGRAARHEARRHQRHVREQRADAQGRAQVRAGATKENFQRIERRYGSFTRSFTLPTTVDASRISAALQGRRADRPAAAARRSEAEADRRQRRIARHARAGISGPCLDECQRRRDGSLALARGVWRQPALGRARGPCHFPLVVHGRFG